MTPPSAQVQFARFTRSFGGTYSAAIGQPSWLTKIMVLVAALVLICLLLVLIVPMVVIGGVALIALRAAAKIRSLFRRGTRSELPDGRENVRVVVRSDSAQDAS